MGILEDFFGAAPCAPAARGEVQRLLQELIEIGHKDDFLSERPGSPFNAQCRHVRAREIGKRLNELGGLALLEWVHRRVRRKLKDPLASHLSYAWSEIGEWVP
ncbi:MAG: hypothetical protein LDL12_08320 [Anaerolinea sp.]|nr:hypothetical protein [Anaerolinea sp.]